MLNDFISIIESLDVTLQEFTYICIILYVLSKPFLKLIKYLFGGVK